MRWNAPLPLSMMETRDAGEEKHASRPRLCTGRPCGWAGRLIITAGRLCRRGRRGLRWRKTSTSKCPPWWKHCQRWTVREGHAVQAAAALAPVQEIGRDRNRSEVDGVRKRARPSPPFLLHDRKRRYVNERFYYLAFGLSGRFSRQSLINANL